MPDGINTITVTVNGSSFDWTSTIGIDAVIVKGGTDSNLYVYDPPAESFGDTGLHAPINPANGQPFGLCHLELCYDVEPATNTPTNTPTATATDTPTNTATDTPTNRPTNTPTNTPIPFQGCTPGYWKQSQHLDSWVATSFSPNQTLESVFDVPNSFGLDNRTLLQALSFQGGSSNTAAARILLRAAVSALLNSASPDVNYPLTTAQVIAQVNAALASNDRSAMLTLASQLDSYNNLGCPLH